MAGTKSGAIKAKQTIIVKHGADHWKRIGALGGAASTTGGFYHTKYVRGNFEAIAAAGKKGGTISRKGKRVTPVTPPLLNTGMIL